nr:MAG TPA: hypothetical protein [Caudoviricetes sp.]
MVKLFPIIEIASHKQEFIWYRFFLSCSVACN